MADHVVWRMRWSRRWQRCSRRVVVSTADSHSSNIIAEEADGNLFLGCAHEHLRCTRHRMDTCEKRCSDLVPRTISGVVNWGLWIAEHLAELRQEMANIIREKHLRVLKPPLSRTTGPMSGTSSRRGHPRLRAHIDARHGTSCSTATCAMKT